MLNAPGQYQSYLLRLYRPATNTAWRVILETIPGGEQQGFADLQAAFEFLRSQVPSPIAPALTSLQIRKLTRRFHLLDTNGDGLIEEADYEAVVQRLAGVSNLAPGSRKFEAMRIGYVNLWFRLQEQTDTTQAMAVTLDDFLRAAVQLVAVGDVYARQIEPLANALLDVFDADQDGQLNAEEWANWFMALGVTRGDTAATFRRIDHNRDGHITRAEVLGAIEEFYHGNNPDAPGTWLFGPC